MREFGRDLRVAEFIREELASVIKQQMRDPRIGAVSVNDVRVSKDLSFADVYISSMETADAKERDDLVAILNRASGFLRSQLAQRHSMRTTPKPRFHYDIAIERGPRLDRLITDALAADRKESVHG